MTYQHKKTSCAKKTKDILNENFLKVKKAEYALEETTEPLDKENHVGKVMKNDINTLPSDTEEVLSEDNVEDAQEHIPDIGNGEYTPEEETRIEPETTKKSIEKKKGMRNYMDFRIDYEHL
jgi:hypothetical protein